MPSTHIKVTATVSRAVLDQLDALVAEQAYPSRSAAIDAALTKSAEKPRHSCRGWIGVGRAGLNAQAPNKTHAVSEPSMGEGTAEVEAPAFMPGRMSRQRWKPRHSCRGGCPRVDLTKTGRYQE
jgi:Arc/MetJ-type ribon-helix-helix transcriptional regulator